MRLLSIHIIFSFVFGTSVFSYSQESEPDTLTFAALARSKVSFFLDDTYVMGGVNHGGVSYSNHARNLSYGIGPVFGLEQYFPLSGKVFLTAGINASQLNFRYSVEPGQVEASNWYLNIPISTAWELPIWRRYDFRIILGAFVGMRLDSEVNGYENFPAESSDYFIYNTSDFNRFDVGWSFGASMEHRNVIVRIRSFTGFINIDKKDQGIINTFNLEIGYFLFRSLNNR